MNGLLQKFEKVKLKTNSLIPADDKLELDKIHDMYEETMEQLDEWRSFYELQDQRDPMPGFSWKISEGRDESKVYVSTPMRDDVNPFRLHKYYVGYSFEKIHKLITSCREQYIREVYHYFKRKYTLEIDQNKNKFREVKNLSYNDIVLDIREQLGGLNFAAIAKQQIIDLLRGKIYVKTNVNLSNKSVSFDNYMSFSYNGRDIPFASPELEAIERAVTQFEFGAPKRRFMFNDDDHYNTEVKFTEDYLFPQLEKLEGIRIYKNRKFMLKFKSAIYAKEFYEYFDFDSLKESRW